MLTSVEAPPHAKGNDALSPRFLGIRSDCAYDESPRTDLTMFDSPPPPAVASVSELSAAQAADLTCARVGATIIAVGHDASLDGGRLRRFYLRRLAERDPKRDWRELATPLPATVTYGTFMGQLQTCHDELQASEDSQPDDPTPQDK
jgi:hypothetical protein